MNVRAFVPIDKAAFFDVVRAQIEGRYEYDRGRIARQTSPETARHAIVAQRLIFAA